MRWECVFKGLSSCWVLAGDGERDEICMERPVMRWGGMREGGGSEKGNARRGVSYLVTIYFRISGVCKTHTSGNSPSLSNPRPAGRMGPRPAPNVARHKRISVRNITHGPRFGSSATLACAYLCVAQGDFPPSGRLREATRLDSADLRLDTAWTGSGGVQSPEMSGLGRAAAFRNSSITSLLRVWRRRHPGRNGSHTAKRRV